MSAFESARVVARRLSCADYEAGRKDVELESPGSILEEHDQDVEVDTRPRVVLVRATESEPRSIAWPAAAHRPS